MAGWLAGWKLTGWLAGWRAGRLDGCLLAGWLAPASLVGSILFNSHTSKVHRRQQMSWRLSLSPPPHSTPFARTANHPKPPTLTQGTRPPPHVLSDASCGNPIPRPSWKLPEPYRQKQYMRSAKRWSNITRWCFLETQEQTVRVWKTSRLNMRLMENIHTVLVVTFASRRSEETTKSGQKGGP